MVLGHGDASASHGLPKSSRGAQSALRWEGGVEETVAAYGKGLNVKSKKVEKAIFQMRFVRPPPTSLLLGPPSRDCKSTAGGQDTRSSLGGGLDAAPPAERTPPGGPRIDPKPS